MEIFPSKLNSLKHCFEVLYFRISLFCYFILPLHYIDDLSYFADSDHSVSLGYSL